MNNQDLINCRNKYDLLSQKISDILNLLSKCESLESINDLSAIMDEMLAEKQQLIEQYKALLQEKINAKLSN